MNQNYYSHLRSISTFVLLLSFTLLIMACGGETTSNTIPPTDPSENWESFEGIVATSEPTAVPVAVVPSPTPTKQPTPTPPPAVMAPDDGCITCHSSQEMLEATAGEEEAVEELSEGEG